MCLSVAVKLVCCYLLFTFWLLSSAIKFFSFRLQSMFSAQITIMPKTTKLTTTKQKKKKDADYYYACNSISQ